MRKLWILFFTFLALTLTVSVPRFIFAQSVASGGSKSVAAADKIDINSATKEQLDALPGIGEAYAQKIIDHRPYRTKRDLVIRKIIPQSTYDKVKDQIIAHHSTEKSPAK